MLTLVTVIYGDARQYRVELYGSVLSLLKQRRNQDTRIVVYTDRPLEGFPLPVTERIIMPAEWSSWTRGSGITHLVKLHLVRQTLDDSGGPVIYFDTDTLFLCPPEQLADRLSPTTALMHAAEGPIAGHAVCARIVEWLGAGREICGVSLSPATVMHNSGIVGVVTEHRAALMRSVDIADALYAVDPIFSLDQLSTGASLSAGTSVVTCVDDVLHYWGWNRAFIRDAIDAYWQEHEGASLVETYATFDPVCFTALPRIHPVDKLRARWQAWRHRLSDDGRFAYLAALSAQRAAGSDAAAANNWFAVHLDFIDRMPADNAEADLLRRIVEQRYPRYQTWLNESNAARLSRQHKPT